MLKNQRALQIAWDRGYRVTETGTVHRLNGEPVRVGTSPKGYGYIKIQCRPEGINHMVSVHRLAAAGKYGIEAVLRSPLVRHLNDVKTDNSSENIALGDNRANYMDRSREQRVAVALQAAVFTRTVPVEVVREIRARKLAGESTCGIARALGLHKGKVSTIVTGKLYGTVV